jgi:hypothetical protein
MLVMAPAVSDVVCRAQSVTGGAGRPRRLTIIWL